jgi:poly(A) polymerase
MTMLPRSPVALALGEALAGTSFARSTWLVGGAVRDAWLGREREGDADVVTESPLDDLLRALEAKGWPTVARYPRFGTAALRIAETTVEVVQARAESYAPDSRKPDVRPATLREDLLRRDFTINTLTQDLVTGEVRDVLGTAFGDLGARLLRTPLDPVRTFEDDPLRLLRAVRFRAELDFDYAPGLAAAANASADRLAIVSAERIRDEFARMLVSPNAARALGDLVEFGLMSRIVPELLEGIGCPQGDYHHLDVFGHTLAVVQAAPPNRRLRLAALFHDIAKPACRSVDAEGRVRFLGHERVGAEVTRARMRALRFSEAEADDVALLVRNHMRVGSFERFTPAAARRLLRDLGPSWPALLELAAADQAAHLPGAPRADLEYIRNAMVEAERRTPPAVLVSPLNGHEVRRALGLAPGPLVGRAKRFLEDAVIAGRLAPGDKTGARALLSQEFRSGNQNKLTS